MPIVSALALHELVGFFRKIDPALRMAIECEPLFHNPARARLEALADPIVDEFVDALFWDLHDEFGARRHHREDLAVHFERARAESLSRLARHVVLAGQGSSDGRESGVGCGRLSLRGPR